MVVFLTAEPLGVGILLAPGVDQASVGVTEHRVVFVGVIHPDARRHHASSAWAAGPLGASACVPLSHTWLAHPASHVALGAGVLRILEDLRGRAVLDEHARAGIALGVGKHVEESGAVTDP